MKWSSGELVRGFFWAVVFSISHCVDSSVEAKESLESYLFPERNAQRKGIRTNVLLVLKDNRVLWEQYAEGFVSDRPYLLWSMTKSFTNVLMAIAAQEGLVRLDEPVFSEKDSNIKIRDALSWATCLDWNETYEFNPIYSSVIRMLYSVGRDDMFSFVKKHRLRCRPGSSFRYSSGDSLLLMGHLKTKLSSEEYAAYPWKKLFEPLGMNSAVWERDSKGVFVGSSFLYLSPQDLMRFSSWLLKEYANGSLKPWLGATTQVSESFDRRTKEAGLWPGAHWWVNGDSRSQRFPRLPVDLFAALGHWGQSLSFIPSKGMAILRLADDRDPKAFDYERMIQMILEEFT